MSWADSHNRMVQDGTCCSMWNHCYRLMEEQLIWLLVLSPVPLIGETTCVCWPNSHPPAGLTSTNCIVAYFVLEGGNMFPPDHWHPPTTHRTNQLLTNSLTDRLTPWGRVLWEGTCCSGSQESPPRTHTHRMESEGSWQPISSWPCL
jgi:hypothetical protein